MPELHYHDLLYGLLYNKSTTNRGDGVNWLTRCRLSRCERPPPSSGERRNSEVLSTWLTDNGPAYHAMSVHLCRAVLISRRSTYRGFSSPTLSFIPDLKPSFSANLSHCSLSFSSSELTTWFPRLLLLLLIYLRLLFSFSVLQFLVVVSVR